MKRTASCLFLLLFLLALPLRADAYSAEAYCVIETESGDVVLSANAGRRLPMASTTKIMTALLILENCAPDEIITVPAAACGIEGTSVYLTPGEELTAEALVSAILLNSANDAAAAGAIWVSGSVASFAALMNERAEEIGMQNTRFVNPHGLSAEGHYTTARDLSLLIRCAMKNPAFARITGTYRCEIPQNGVPDARLLINHNKLLRTLPGCIGGKTGYTREAGRCLVSVCQRDGVTLAAVTLNDPDDWNDHAALYDAAFPLFYAVRAAAPDEWSFSVPVTGGDVPYVTVSNADALSLTLRKNADGSEKILTAKADFPSVLTAPVSEGDPVGTVTYYADGIAVGKITLTAKASAAKQPAPVPFRVRFLRFLRRLLGTPMTF